MRRRVALLAALALAALSVPLAPATADATSAREVSGATLRWGVSNEANNSAYFGNNFLSAGTLGNPGAGGKTLTAASKGQLWSNGKRAGWSAASSNVAIEKRTPSGVYAAATWAGLTTSPTGAPIAPPTSNAFSDHTVVLSAGTGWADPQTGRAEISWRGSFTVVAYSGMTFFTVRDPALVVGRDGSGVVRATLSGYGSSLDDQSVWKTMPTREVTLATLSSVEVTDDGTVVTPTYAGVELDTAALGITEQVRTGSTWGSWPRSFIAWLAEAGSASYWYSSGSALDANKLPLPIDVAWTLGDVLGSDPDDPGVPEDPDPEPTTPTTPTKPGGSTGTGGNNGGGTASKAFTVSDAQLRWGLSQEMSNSAFAPGTYNFFSAGTVPNPGRGGQKLAIGDWSARHGNVRIEKATSSGGHRLATWAGLGTTSDGQPLGAATNGLLSGHTVVVDGGTGRVDPKKRTATIRWKGTFTVLLYSGMSYFTVTDPVLTVRGKAVRLDATLGGYATDRDDTSVWTRLPATTVRLADASLASLKHARGFTTTPRYAGVRYEAPAGAVAQSRAGSGWGAFPASYVRFQERVGTAAYWYSSGAATDRFKTALPFAVSYDADKPVTAPRTDDGDTAAPPGANTPGTTAPGSTTSPTPGAVPAALPAPATVVGAGAVPVGTTEGIRPVAESLDSSAPRWPWWAGGAMVVAALLLTVVSRLATRRTP